MRRVLISGGTRGIGYACVERFCACGDAVAFIYHVSDERAREIAGRLGAHAICADVSREDEVNAAVAEAIEYLGGIDVLVNNAGISVSGLFTDMSGDEWRRVIDTNLSSVFFMSREVSRYMISRHSGRIINIGSVWGRVGASCEVAYSASKAGVRGLTMAMAKELGLSGITVNCIEPGVIDTDMNRCYTSEVMAELAQEAALGRTGQAEEVAEAVEFLSSDRAGFITGQVIGVDGGL